jgi:hypothetical protein
MSAPRKFNGQLANVSAIFIVASGCERYDQAKNTAALLARLFEDLVIVGGDPSWGQYGRLIECSDSHGFTAGLECAREERALIVVASGDSSWFPADLLLGLTAWPEHEFVAPSIDREGSPSCALVQCEAALVVLRAIGEKGVSALSSLEALRSKLDASVIEGDDLAALLGTRTSIS